MARAAPGPEAAPPTPAMLEEAAGWLMRLHEAPAGAPEQAAERAACERWRAAAPAHEQAWQRMQRVWTQFDTRANEDALPPGAARRAIEAGHAAARQRARRVPAGRSLVAVLLALLVGGVVWQGGGGPSVWLADARSPVGERRVLTLPDQGQLTLDSGAAVDLHFAPGERRVVLRQGQVAAQVASDAARAPFVIETPQGTAQALGTQYLVRLEPGHTVVTVLESTVRACAGAADAPDRPCVQLQPGEQVRLSAQGLEPVRRVDAGAEAAWLRGQLAVDDRPLAEVLQALSAHRRGLLRFDAAQLEGVRVSGVFALDDTDRALAVLQASVPIEVRRYTPWLTVVSRR